MLFTIHIHKTIWEKALTKTKAKKIYSSIVKIFLFLLIPTITLVLTVQLTPCISDSNLNDISHTTAEIVGTIIAIIFSFLLLIIEKISSKYSPSFLHHVIRNHTYIFTTLYSIVFILFCLFFAPSFHHYSLYIISFCLTLFLELFIISLKETIKLMNPKYSILDPEVDTTKKWLRETISKEEEKQAKIAPKRRPFDIPNKIEQELEQKLLPIRDIIIRAISDANLQEARDGINAFTKIAIFYLYCRKNFSSNSDDFLYFVYTEFLNIAGSALKNNNFHYRIHPILIESLEKISKEALEVEISPSWLTSGNYLLAFPVQGIELLCSQNLAFYNSAAPSYSCTALERIGLLAIEKGFPDSVSLVVSKLANISKSALSAGSDFNFLSRQANIAIAKIIYTFARKRGNMSNRQNFNVTLNIMLEDSVCSIITEALKKQKNKFNLIEPLSPFICKLYEFPTTVSNTNLANLASTIIFSSGQAYLINSGLEDICNSIYLRIFSFIGHNIPPENQHYDVTEKFVDTIYASQFYLLSTLNPKLRKAFSITAPENFNEKLDKSKVINIFEQGLNILWYLFERNERNEYNNSHVLDALFSLVIICLCDQDFDIKLAKSVKNAIRKMDEVYRSKDYSSRETFFKYCRILNKSTKSVTGKNVIQNVPKYEKTEGYIPGYYRTPGDDSLPFDDPTESAFYGQKDYMQWKILGTNILNNEYINNLNKKIWGL